MLKTLSLALWLLIYEYECDNSARKCYDCKNWSVSRKERRFLCKNKPPCLSTSILIKVDVICQKGLSLKPLGFFCANYQESNRFNMNPDRKVKHDCLNFWSRRFLKIIAYLVFFITILQFEFIGVKGSSKGKSRKDKLPQMSGKPYNMTTL